MANVEELKVIMQSMEVIAIQTVLGPRGIFAQGIINTIFLKNDTLQMTFVCIDPY